MREAMLEENIVDNSNNNTGGSYFTKRDETVEVMSTGCVLLDCVLGGGYPVGRIVNIIGDSASGKSLLGIEACANFAYKYPDGQIWYAEAEAAFDLNYAEALGLPVNKVNFVDTCLTVEDFFEHLIDCIKELKKSGDYGLYILDSLDALSDRAEISRRIDEGSFGAQKAKKMSELFRRLVRHVEDSKMTIIIISQIRDNIGVVFGKKYTRSGGRALDFYASQKLYLAQVKTLRITRKKIQRPVGVEIKIKCEKNKIGLPYRECKFPIIFGYGIDDMFASIEWLETIGKLNDVLEELETVLGKMPPKRLSLQPWMRYLNNAPDDDIKKLSEFLSSKVTSSWQEIENAFLVTRKKYK